MKKLLSLIFALAAVFALSLTVHAAAPQLVEEPTVLAADATWTGDFIINSSIDLKGFTLKVEGNLILVNGTINLNSGKLIVTGDFRIQGLDKKSWTIDYSKLAENEFKFCNGRLEMNNAADYVQVGGNFYPNGKDNLLRAGTVELMGDFMYTTNAYMDCYNSVGSHKTLFTGNGDQRVFFSRSGSQFSVLGIKKKTGKMLFESKIDVGSIDEDTIIPVGGNGYLYLYLYGNKTFSLNGHSLTVDGHLFLDRGELNIAGGSLTVTKDLRLQSIKSFDTKAKLNISQLVKEDFTSTTTPVQLTMKTAKDKVTVQGNTIMNARNEQVGLRAGVMVLKGDFTQIGMTNGVFKAYDTHKVILSGTKKQTVSFASPSYLDNKGKLRELNHFNILQIDNKDVVFATKYWAKKLIPFVLNVNLNTKAVKFAKYNPMVINGVIYFQVAEINKLFGINLVYNTKSSAASGKHGSKNLSVKGMTSSKVNYIRAEDLLKQMKLKYSYDPAKKTLFITK